MIYKLADSHPLKDSQLSNVHLDAVVKLRQSTAIFSHLMDAAVVVVVGVVVVVAAAVDPSTLRLPSPNVERPPEDHMNG